MLDNENKKFFLLFIFFVAYLWFKTFSGAVLPVHYLNEGLSLTTMMGGLVSVFLGQIAVLLICRKLSSRISWLLALLASILFLLLIIKINYSWQYLIASALAGTSIFFYFMFYNIAYFENTAKTKIGINSALMFSMATMIGLTAPLLAGFLGQISFNLIWIISIVFFLPALILVFYQQDFAISYSIKAAISEIRATRVFIFLEGIWEALVFGIIPIYTLYFIKTPLGYGTFAAYLSLVGIVANLTLGKLTDRLQKRVVFLYPLTIILAFVTISFAFFSNSLTAWLILTAIISFLLPLFWNITTAMVVDSHSNLRLAIPGREIVLAVGRFAGLLLTFLSFLLEKTPQYIFLILGGILLLYPLILWWRTKVSREFNYL